jgi:PAS domain S-box-containing protein
VYARPLAAAGVLPQYGLRMTTAKKLWLGFGVLLALLVVTTLVITGLLSSLQRDLSHISAHEAPTTVAAYEMQINFVEMGLAVLKYLDSGEAELRQRAVQYTGDFQRFKADYDRLAETGQEQELASRVENVFEQFAATGNSLMEKRDEQTELFAALAKSFDALDQAIDRIRENLDRDGVDGLRKVETLANLRANAAGVGNWLGNLWRTSDSIYQRHVLRDAEDFRAGLAHFRKLSLTAEERQAAADLEEAFARVTKHAERALALHTSKREQLTAFLGLRMQLDTILDDEVQAPTQGRLRAAQESARAALNWIVGAILGMLVLGAVIGAATAHYATRAVVRSETEIQAARLHAETIVDRVRIPLVILWKDLRVRSANEAFYDTFQVTQAETEGRLIYDLGNGQWNLPRLRELLEQVLPQNSQFQEFEIVHGFERIGRRTMLVSARRLTDQGDDREMILLAIEDVTARRRADQDLRESEARKAAMLDSALDCVVTMDAQGQIVEFNPACEKCLGHRREDVIGKTVAETLIPARFREAHERGLLNYLKTGQGPVLGQRIEMPALRADGSEFPCELSISAARLPDDSVFFTASLRDVTQRKRIELEREQLLASERTARSEAERLNVVKDEFLATVSHELRTPLQAILGWSQMLRSGKLDRDAAAKAAETIETNARSQSKLIEDLLDVSRIISGKIVLEIRPVALPDVIRQAIETVRPAAEAKGVRLEQRVDKKQVSTVIGDANRLQQVVWNLVSNAIKFTPKGGRVVVTLTQIDGEAQITVKDTGQGIKPEFLSHVFERFRQADASTTRRHGGLGLGLAIVRHLVELHGGHVDVESPGEAQGATFYVTLPLASVQVGPPGNGRRRRASEPEETVFEPTPLDGTKVLVVDDEPSAREVIQRVLETAGASVAVAASAVEGFELVQSFKPDVVVSDIGMPEEDGYQLIRRIRALDAAQGGKTPAAALTALARSEDRTRALMAGYQTHVAKPVEPAELTAVVASLAGLGQEGAAEKDGKVHTAKDAKEEAGGSRQ